MGGKNQKTFHVLALPLGAHLGYLGWELEDSARQQLSTWPRIQQSTAQICKAQAAWCAPQAGDVRAPCKELKVRAGAGRFVSIV
jgi:hypothetical protein